MEDIFGRNQDNVNINSLIANMLKPAGNSVHNKHTINSKKREEEQNQLLNKVMKSGANIQQNLSDATKLVNLIKSEYSKKKQQKVPSNLFQDLGKLVKAGLKKGSIHTSDDNLQEMLKKELKNQAEANKKMFFADLPSMIRKEFETEKVRAGNARWSTHAAAQGADRIINTLVKGLSAIGIPLIGGGILQGEIEYMRNMRQIGFITENITGDMDILQHQWTYLDNVVAQTGKSRIEFQQEYMKLFQRGFKDQSVANRLTKTSLNTSTLIASDASETASMFADWNQHLGLTDMQLADIGKGLQQTAKYSGLTGSQLLTSAKSAENLMQTLRNAGNLNAAYTKNILNIAAEAQKLGISQDINSLLDSASSPIKFLNASQGTQALLITAAGSVGKTFDLIDGSILNSTANIKALSQGLSNIIKIHGYDIDKISELNEAQKRDLNYRLSGYGFEIGQIERMQKVLNEAGKTFSDRLEDIRRKRKELILTTEGSMKLDKEESDLWLAKGQEFVSLLSDAISKRKMPSLNAEQVLDLQTLTGLKDVKDTSQLLQAAAYKQAQTMVRAGMKDFTKTLESSGGDSRIILEALEAMTAEQQKFGVEQINKLDPISQVAQYTRLINEWLGKNGLQLVNYMADLNTVMLLIAANVSILAASGIAKIWKTTTSALAHYVGNILSISGDGFGEAIWKNRPIMDSNNALIGTNIAKGIFEEFVGFGGHVTDKIDDLGVWMTGRFGKIGDSFAKTLKGEGFIGAKVGTLGAEISTWLGLTEPVAANFIKSFSLLTRVGGPAAILATSIMSLTQAFKAGELAANIFNVSQDKLTTGQRWAAEGAGLLTGVLNALTFGIFDCLEPTGSWTQNIAKFLEVAFPLSWTLQLILVPFKALWGVLKGLYLFVKNIFIGIWDSIKIILEPFVELWTDVKEILKDTFAPLKGLGGLFSENATIISVLSNILGGLGKAVAWVIKLLATLVATVLRFVFLVLKPIIKIISLVIKPFVAAIASIVEGIQTFLGGIGDVLSGIFKLDFKLFAAGFKNVLFGIIKAIPGALYEGIKAIPSMLIEGFQWLITGLPKMIGSALASVWNSFMDLIPFGSKMKIDTGKENAGKHNINEFAVGTNSIKRSGLAMLHAGEVIIPASMAKAIGDGPFSLSKIKEKAGMAKDSPIGQYSSSKANTLKDLGATKIKSLIKNIKPKDALKLVKGAALLTALVPGIVGLSVVIVKLSKGIMGLAGIDSKTAQEIASNVAGVIGSAGAIALAVIGSTAAIAGLGMLSQFAAGMLPKMLIGAGALLVLTPAIVGLAEAIAFLSKKIMDIGLEPNILKATVENLTTLLKSIGIISTSILISTAAIAALGTLATFAPVILPPLLAGAAALLVLTPAITALAVALVYMTKKIMDFGLNKQDTEKVTEQLVSLIKSAGVISVAITAATVAITGLGLLAAFTPVILPPLLAGAAALLVLTPAITALASAMVYLSEKVMSVFGIDINKTSKIAEGVASLLQSASMIAQSVLRSALALTALGMLASISSALITPMLMGAGAILFLTPAMIALASSVIKLSEGVMRFIGIDPKKAENIAAATASILNSASSIAKSVLISAVSLTLLGAMAAISPFLMIPMRLGALAIMALTPAMVALSSSIIYMASKVMKSIGVDVNMAAATAKAVSQLFEAGSNIVTSVLSMVPKIIKLGLLSFFVPTILGAMYVGSQSFKLISTGVANFVKSTIEFANNIIKESNIDINSINNSISSITKLIDIIYPFITTLQEKFSLLSDRSWFGLGSSITDKAAEGAKALGQQIRVFSKALKDHLLSSLNTLPDINFLNGIVNRISTIMEIMSQIPQLLNQVDKEVLPLADSGKLLDMSSRLANFEKGFSPVIGSINRIASDVQPVLGSDIETIIKKDKTSTDTPQKQSAADSSMLITLGKDQLLVLSNIYSVLSDIQDTISVSPTEEIPISNKGSSVGRVPTRSTNYRELPIGRYGQGPQKQITNIGLT